MKKRGTSLTPGPDAGEHAAPMNDTPGIPARVLASVKAGLAAGLKTTLFLAGIMVPVSLGVALLGWSGALAWGARLLSPVMHLVGLPGEAALVLLSSIFLNIYSAIAVIGTLTLTMREITILAVMCLVAHNMIVETAVMKKIGSSAFKMVVLRLGAALFMAWLLDAVLPFGGTARVAVEAGAAQKPFWDMLAAWGLSTLRLLLKIVTLVFSIMVLQKLLEEFKVTTLLSRIFAPVMRVFGLPEDASFLWIVSNVVGYAYGAGVIVARIREGKMKSQGADLFNHHAGISHSLLEDTALFMAIGVPLFWLVVPRLSLAVAVVWLERIRRHRFRRSFKVGTV